MQDSKVQISPDTWVYVDEDRAKLIVEIDLPKEGSDRPASGEPVRIPEFLRLRNNAC
ncbi:MAG TPA: hypothetical protein VJC37_02895 [Planctomycetota bacterium]|nr:hypothetical protein [Planctomycetota bacterium]